MIQLTVTGTQDGVNRVFSLGGYIPNTLELYLSGILMKEGVDYTRLLNVITFTPPVQVNPGDILQAFGDTLTYVAGTYPTTYQSHTLSQLVSEISDLLDDPTQVYWTAQEVAYAVYEGLLYWGALTGYWRERGAFSVPATQQSFVGTTSTPYVDLSLYMPNLRRRTFTLDRMVREIQYILLETANGIAGTGMSGQITVSSILTALRDARNRFVQDAKFPITYHTAPFATPNPSGMIPISDNSVFLHRACWKDYRGVWTPLWREDTWAADHGSPLWTTTPGTPQKYSEAENAPLVMQLIPPPATVGSIEALTVDSLDLNLTDPAALFEVPDEWAHAIKYAALAELLSSAGQISDPVRAEYCDKRYEQYVEFAKQATSVLRVMADGVPLPIDSLAKVDLGNLNWMNQPGRSFCCGVLYDWVVPVPSNPSTAIGYTVDVVRTAPLPSFGDYIQLGEEDIHHLKDYVQHILTFKCGGKDFLSTLSDYDSFMGAADRRMGINKAKIQYLDPLFHPDKAEQGVRPDRVESSQNA
jgi:hypothetical protein